MKIIENILSKSKSFQNALQKELYKIAENDIRLRSIIERRNYNYSESQFGSSNKSDHLKAYETYVWVYAAVYAIATSAARVPLRIYKLVKDKRTEEITDGWAWELTHRPNPFQSYFDFIEAIMSSLELTGDAYIEKGGFGENEYPDQLYILRPDKIEIVPSKVNLIKEYRYSINGNTIVFGPKEICHINYYHPRSELYGMSAISPSVNSLILDLYALKYQKNFFRQGGMLNVYIKVPKPLGDKEFQRLKEQFRSEYSGVERSHLLGVIDNDGTIEEVGVDPQKFLLKEQRTMSRDEVLAAFGVPPVMVGLLDAATFNNTEQQKRAFWENTIMPKLKKIEDKLNQEFYWPLEYECEFDFSGIQPLQEDEEKKAKTATTLVNNGILTPNEARKKYYNLEAVPGGDTLKLSTIPVQLSMSSNTTALTKLDKNERIQKALSDFENENKKYINDYFSLVVKYFKMASSSIINLIKDKYHPEKIEKASLLEMAMARLDDETINMADELAKLHIDIMGDVVKDKYRQLTGLTPSKDVMERSLKTIKRNSAIWAKRSRDEIIDTLKNRITNVVKEAISEDLTVNDFTKEIQKIFEGDELRGEYPHARMIARTETSRAVNTGRFEGMKSAGIKKKEWVPGGPPNDREWHTAFGELGPVDIDYVYKGQYGNLLYPGDPNAPPGELCNCRCTIIETLESMEE